MIDQRDIATLERVGAVLSDEDARTLRDSAAEAAAAEDPAAALAAADAGVEAAERLIATSARRARIGSDDAEIRQAFADCEAHYGTDSCAPSWFDVERSRTVQLRPFALDAEEVSFAEFARFVDESGYTPTSTERGWSLQLLPDLGIATLEGYTWATPTGPGSDHRAVPELPVAHVSYFDADAFCRFRNARLPSRAEWEVAMRGAERAVYASYFDPAGYRPDAPGEPTLGTRAVDDDSMRDADTGLHGATGNVWEWTTTVDPTHSGGSRRFLKGGSWKESAPVNMRLAALRSEYPGDSYIDVGFRCVEDRERWP